MYRRGRKGWEKRNKQANRSLTDKNNTTMLGIILWAILIFVIVCYACPGFFTALIVIMASVFAAYGLIIWLCGAIAKAIKNRKK